MALYEEPLAEYRLRTASGASVTMRLTAAQAARLGAVPLRTAEPVAVETAAVIPQNKAMPVLPNKAGPR